MVIEDLLLDDADEQQDDYYTNNQLFAEAAAPVEMQGHAVAGVFAGIPKNLDEQLHDAKFFVALPSFRHTCVIEGFASLQVPAAYLQERLTAVQQQAAHQQRQHQPKLVAAHDEAPANSGAAAVQLLLPACSANSSSSDCSSVVADVQLASLSV